jgi:hypothetical protein
MAGVFSFGDIFLWICDCETDSESEEEVESANNAEVNQSINQIYFCHEK